jgi:hypothetical protein
MRLKLGTLALAGIFLLLSGFRLGSLPYTPGMPFSDAATSHLPAAQFLRESVLENGEFPVWRETIMAGQPFAANPLNKTAYPLQWLALLLSAEIHLDLMILLHLLLAGAGMWWFAKALGLREAACALAALSYGLAPRMVGHLGAGHLDIVYALAWLPWLLGTCYALITSDADKLRNILWVALFAALMLLADVRLSLFGLALAGAYVFYEALRQKRLRRIEFFAQAGLLAGLLTLSLFVPLLVWQPSLSRAGLTMQDAGVFSLAPAQLLGMVFPPRTGNIETLTYLGLPVLVLAIVGVVTARRWFWTGAAGVAALYALGINAPLWTTLVQVFPPLLMFRVPSRAWLVLALSAALLAGFGLEWLIRVVEQCNVRRVPLLALVGTLVAIISGVFLTVSVPAVNGLSVLVGGGGIGIICLLALAGRLRGERLALAVLVIVFLDLALMGRGWLEWRTRDAWLPPQQMALAQRLTELDAYRVYSPTYSLQQQVAEEYHLRLFGGVDPFQLKFINVAIEQGSGVQASGYSVVMPPLTGNDLATVNRDAVPDTAVLGEWGVTHVAAAYALDVPNLRLVEEVAPMQAGDGMIYLYANTDPALTTEFYGSPHWIGQIASYDGTIPILNFLTETAALFSGVALVTVLGGIIVLKVRN